MMSNQKKNLKNSMNNIIQQYAELTAQIEQLTTQRDSLKDQVKAQVIADGGKKETPLGKFSIRKIKKWIYPAYVTDAEETYKAEKAKAEEIGDASYEESESLTFSLLKI